MLRGRPAQISALFSKPGWTPNHAVQLTAPPLSRCQHNNRLTAPSQPNATDAPFQFIIPVSALELQTFLKTLLGFSGVQGTRSQNLGQNVNPNLRPQK